MPVWIKQITAGKPSKAVVWRLYIFFKKKKTLANAGHILPSNKRIFHNFTPSIRFKKPVHLNAIVAVY